MFYLRTQAMIAAGTLGLLAAATGCSGSGGGSVGGASLAPQSALPASSRMAETHSDVSILKMLKHQVVIGSAIDPINHARNPYGLTVAPATAGKLTAGDLVVCNFNGKSNVQGSGKSIVVLHPVPGSTPTHLTENQTLLGCDALALSPDDTIWAAAMAANDNPVLASSGKVLADISGKPFSQPWGQVFAAPTSGAPAFYESNGDSGSIVRINLGSTYTFDKIATGFPTNRGVAGTILAPSGLAYDPTSDTLYFADGKNNTLVAFANVSTIPKFGIQARNHGMSFSGPNASNARIVFSGAPLNGPISTALLPNGNLVVGNTLDPSGQNLLVEIAADGTMLDVLNVDTGAAGSIFGLVATGTGSSDAKLYFNDDNANNVQVLER